MTWLEAIASLFSKKGSGGGSSSGNPISEPSVAAGLDGSNWTVATGGSSASATNTKAAPGSTAESGLDSGALLVGAGIIGAVALVWIAVKH